MMMIGMALWLCQGSCDGPRVQRSG